MEEGFYWDIRMVLGEGAGSRLAEKAHRWICREIRAVWWGLKIDGNGGIPNCQIVRKPKREIAGAMGCSVTRGGSFTFAG